MTTSEKKIKIPQVIITRKDEITSIFFQTIEIHFAEILSGRIDYMYHIKDFASLQHIDSRHFSNTIKLTTGKSPCEHVEERIMIEAKKMLDDKTLSVKEICYKLTYKEPTNFSKFFKAMEGITPTQYRNRKTENNTFL
jgi:AraC-like DNA-binding protein